MDDCHDLLCRNWESTEGKPDVFIYKEGEAYKVTVSKRSGIRHRLKPETHLLQEKNDNLSMNAGFHIDVSYDEMTDILTFSPDRGYVGVSPKSEKRTFEDWNPDGYPHFSEMKEACGKTARPQPVPLKSKET